MEPDALQAARLRYRAAYAAYQERAQRVAQKLDDGEKPSVDEILEEAKAPEELAAARHDLLNAMAASLRERS